MSGGRAAARPVSAWRFLRRNPDYVEAWHAVAARLPSQPGGNLGVRAQTDEDLEAAAWGLLAWEDPLDEDGPASPFWAEAPMLDAEAAPRGVPPLAKVIEEAGARLAGLRLADGALVLKIERDSAAAQVRIAHAGAFDLAGGLVLRLAFGLELPVALARVRDLWAIVDAGGRKDGGPYPGPGRASSCSPSTKLAGKTHRLIAIDLYGARRVAEEWAAAGPVRSLVRRRIKRSMHVMDGLAVLAAAWMIAAASMSAAHAGGEPDLITALRAKGAEILSLGSRGGLAGYFVRPAAGGGYGFYLTADGHAVAGLLYAPNGSEITGGQLAAARSAATAAAPAPVPGEATAAVPPAPPSRAALFERSADAFGFTLGERGPLVVLFGDPRCPWSRSSVARLGREALDGRLRLHVIPVAILGAASARAAAGIAASPDPARVWFERAGLPAVRAIAAGLAAHFVPGTPVYGRPLPDIDALLVRQDLAGSYARVLDDALARAATEERQALARVVAEDAREASWMAAAGFFNTIAHRTGLFQAAAHNVPAVALPTPSLAEWAPAADAAVKGVAAQLARSRHYHPMLLSAATSGAGALPSADGDGGGMVSGLLEFIDLDSVIVADSGNPIADLVALGHGLLNAALAAVTALMGAATGSGLFESIPFIGKGLDVFESAWQVSDALVSTLLGILLFAGAVLAYVLPALPFIRFLFGILGWILNVVVAVLAVTVFAAAHITREDGNRLITNTTRQGWLFLPALILRPPLMLLGLILGYFVFLAGIGLFNQIWLPQMRDAGASAGLGPVGFLAMLALYVIVAYGLMNASFKLIDLLPSAVLDWIGGRAGAGDDASERTGSAAVGGISRVGALRIGARARRGGGSGAG